MTVEDTTKKIQNLAAKQKQLEQLLQQIQVHNEQLREFIFDLTDYNQGLSVITKLVPETNEPETIEVTAIDQVLSAQQKYLTEVIHSLKESLEDPQQEFLGQSGGGLRRIVVSLEGLAEMNGYLRRDNQTFQRDYQKDRKAPEQKTKQSFFKKLFGKNQ